MSNEYELAPLAGRGWRGTEADYARSHEPVAVRDPWADYELELTRLRNVATIHYNANRHEQALSILRGAVDLLTRAVRS